MAVVDKANVFSGCNVGPVGGLPIPIDVVSGRHGECFSTLQTHDRANGPAVERGTHHPVVAAEVVRLPHHRTGELMPYIDVGTLMIFKLGKVGIDKASGKRT